MTTGETVDYTHDAIGNLTLANSSVGANDLAQTWDAHGRMTCVRKAATCASSGAEVAFAYARGGGGNNDVCIAETEYR